MEYLRIKREYELEGIISWLPSNGTILEIGAGAGWQASALHQLGFQVAAIDVRKSPYGCHWPVIIYDGKNIPFPNNMFDCIFSSNVLEHISNHTSFQKEMRRVLKPDGTSIHLLPTATWRLWTTFLHYAAVIKKINNMHYGFFAWRQDSASIPFP